MSINKASRIISLYALGITMIIAYFLMDNTSEIRGFLYMIDRAGTPGNQLGFYSTIGLIKYGLLVSGTFIIPTLTFLIITKWK